MARGFASAQEAIAEIEARRSGGGPGGMYFKLDPGQSAVVRFLSDDVIWAHVHALPAEGKSYRNEVCRDQDPEDGSRNGEACPGCDREQASAAEVGWKDRKYRRQMSGVAQVIWRDAPTYEEDEEGKKNWEKVVGHEDQVVKWTFGRNVIETLYQKVTNYKSLTNRDFVVTRTGEKLDTKYAIEPFVNDEGDAVKTPLSDNDKKLIEEAPDISDFFKIPSYDDWGKRGGGGSSNGSAPPTADPSPFMRKKKDD